MSLSSELNRMQTLQERIRQEKSVKKSSCFYYQQNLYSPLGNSRENVVREPCTYPSSSTDCGSTSLSRSQGAQTEKLGKQFTLSI